MTNKLVPLDTEKGLILSDLERKIIEGLSSGKSPKDIGLALGIPDNSIRNLLRKEGVNAFLQELIDARNQLMKMRLPDLLMGIIEDKVLKNGEDEESRLADLSRKDIVDIAKQLNDFLKTTGSEKASEGEDAFAKLYLQINNIQKGNND